MAWPCRYWIVIQDFKQGEQSVVHTFAYQIKWAKGWSDYGAQYSKKHFVEKMGPFNTRTKMLSFYHANKKDLLGGLNARVSDMADRSEVGDCADQA